MASEPERFLRVSAYAVCVDDARRILLCRIAPGATRESDGRWTLPGGGLEHGEHPRAAVLRELTEESGLSGDVSELLDVASSDAVFPPWRDLPATHFHAIQIIYRVTITGGTLRPEVGGSTDECRWMRREDLPGMPLVDLVERVVPLAFGEAG